MNRQLLLLLAAVLMSSTVNSAPNGDQPLEKKALCRAAKQMKNMFENSCYINQLHDIIEELKERVAAIEEYKFMQEVLPGEPADEVADDVTPHVEDEIPDQETLPNTIDDSSLDDTLKMDSHDEPQEPHKENEQNDAPGNDDGGAANPDESLLKNDEPGPVKNFGPGRDDAVQDETIFADADKLVIDSSSNVAIRRELPDLNAISVCLWIRTGKHKDGKPISYAVGRSENEFAVMKTENLQLYVNNKKGSKSDVAIDNSKWNHLCVTWSSNKGQWDIYHNGEMAATGDKLEKQHKIKGGGVIMLGRELRGEIAYVNIWRRIVSADEVASIASDCLGQAEGDFFSWRSGDLDIDGSVQVLPADVCENNVESHVEPEIIGQDGGFINYVTIGCWKDTRDRAVPSLEGTDSRLDGSSRKRDDAVAKCAEVAASKGYAVFTVQHGGECYSGPNAESTYNKHGPSDRCKHDGKGGVWANQVYEIVENQIVCENDTLNLHCNSGSIHVIHASYGRADETTCPGPFQTTSCHAQNSVQLVQQQCEEKSSCSILANDAYFGDPCSGTAKYLQVRYHCQSAQSESGNKHERRKSRDQPDGCTCVAWADPHYVQFDGGKMDFMGKCVYTLVKDVSSSVPAFQVDAKNAYRDGNLDVTLQEYLNIYVYGLSIRIHRDKGGDATGVWIDEKEVTLPANPMTDLYIEKSGKYTLLSASDLGFWLTWDGNHRAEIKTDSRYVGKMVGICGNCDSNSENDMVMPDGGLATSSNQFCDSWRVDCDGESETDGDLDTIDPPECPPDLKLRFLEHDMCGAFMDPYSIFYECGSMLDSHVVDLYTQACLFDMCHIGGVEQLCNNYGSFYDECLEQGHIIQTFRTPTFCPLQCPLHGHYSECVSACPNTCIRETSLGDCPDPCTEGCECDVGFVLSGSECVERADCGCLDDSGLYHEIGHSWVEDDCQTLALCVENNFIHYESLKCHDRAFCGAVNGVYGCHCEGKLTGDGVHECG